MKYKSKKNFLLVLIALISISFVSSNKKVDICKTGTKENIDTKDAHNSEERNTVSQSQEENKNEALFVGCNGFF